MDTNIIIPVTVLILSGLGFLVYNHPLLARKIIIVIMVFVVTSGISSFTFLNWYMGIFEDMESNIDSYTNSEFDNIKSERINYDSLKNAIKNKDVFKKKFDSINKVAMVAMHDNSTRFSGYMDRLRDFRIAESKTEKNIVKALIYDLLALAALVVLFILTYVFNKFWQNQTNKKNKKSPDNTEYESS